MLATYAGVRTRQNRRTVTRLCGALGQSADQSRSSGARTFFVQLTRKNKQATSKVMLLIGHPYTAALPGVFAPQNEQSLSLERSLKGPPAAGRSNNFALTLARASAPAPSQHAPNQAPRRTQHMAH